MSTRFIIRDAAFLAPYHLSQRRALDHETLEQVELQEYIQQLYERKAELQDTSKSTSVDSELEQLEEEIRQTESQLQLAAAVNQHHSTRTKALIDKQRRERGVLSQRVSYELKGTWNAGPAAAGPAFHVPLSS